MLGLGFWLREFPFQTVLGSFDDLYDADVEGTSDLREGFEADEASSVEEEEERGLGEADTFGECVEGDFLGGALRPELGCYCAVEPYAGSLAMLTMILGYIWTPGSRRCATARPCTGIWPRIRGSWCPLR